MEKYKKLIELSKDFLADDKYIEKFILNLYRFKANEIWWVKDINSIHIAPSIEYIKSHGFKTLDQAVGLKDENVPCKVAEFADLLYHQDRVAEKTMKPIHILDHHCSYNGILTYHTTKNPIINPHTKRVLGTMGCAQPFEMTSMLHTILNIHKYKFGNNHSILMDNPVNKFNFTRREFEVLSCICLGFGDRKSIANFLSIVHKKSVQVGTVIDEAFKGLYKKLPCKSASQLLEFALHNNLHLQIPKSFIPVGSFIFEIN